MRESLEKLILALFAIGGIVFLRWVATVVR